jgi:hypothetical protein
MDKDQKLNILLVFSIVCLYAISFILNELKDDINPAISIIIFTVSISVTALLTFIVSSNSINKREKRTRK